MSPEEEKSGWGGKFKKLHQSFTDHAPNILFLSVLVGILAGFSSAALRWAIGLCQSYFLGSSEEHIFYSMWNTPWYQRMLAPVIGGLLVGLMIRYLFSEMSESAVPKVIESVALKGGILRPRIILSRALTSAVTIGSGGSAGREGPVVQIGAAIGSLIGRVFRLPGKTITSLVSSGAAAGIAAAFNAPIAGSLFALEVIAGDFSMACFAPTVLSAAAATVVSRGLFGGYPAFRVPPFSFKGIFEIPLYAVLGFLAAALSLLFIHSHHYFEDRFRELKVPPYIKPALGGLGVGITGIFLPQVMGVGYGSIDLALGINGKLAIWIMLVIMFAKIVTTSFTLGSGGSGGDLVPTLFIGAMLGSSFGILVNMIFPTQTSAASSYGLIGMGAVFAGVMQAPLTAILMAFELTGDFRSVLPLMIVCTISSVIAARICKGSIYALSLQRSGIKLEAGRDLAALRSIFVHEAMNRDFETIHEEAHFSGLIPRILSLQQAYFPVVDNDGRMTGILSFQDIKEILFEEGLEHLVIARDLATSAGIVILRPDDTLDKAFASFTKSNLEAIPVVDPADEKRVVGMLDHRQAMTAYHQALLRRGIRST